MTKNEVWSVWRLLYHYSEEHLGEYGHLANLIELKEKELRELQDKLKDAKKAHTWSLSLVKKFEKKHGLKTGEG